MLRKKVNPWRGLKLPAEAFAHPKQKRKLQRSLMREQIYSRYPRFWEALEADTRAFLRGRVTVKPLPTRRDVVRAALGLAWESDAFLGLVLYRIRGRLLAHDVPVLPQLIHRICIASCQLNIGEPVVIEPGVYIPHGQVVVDGKTLIETNVVLTPWVTIGLRRKGFEGPTLRRGTYVGTGAKVLGSVTVGPGAQIGANAVVIRDVAPNETVVGVPARPIPKEPKKAGRGKAHKRQPPRE